MRSDRYMKKSRKGKCSNAPISVAKQQSISAMMKSIAKIDWSNPYKDFIK
jgi:hypothetical protein